MHAKGDAMSGTIDIRLILPRSIYALVGKVIRHAVLETLVPPVEVVSEWLLEEPAAAQSEQDTLLLNYVRYLLPDGKEYVEQVSDLPTVRLCPETGETTLASSSETNDETMSEIKATLEAFTNEIEDLVVQSFFDRLFPLYMDSQPNANSIQECVAGFRPWKKSQELREEISDVVFGIVTAIKEHLDGERARFVLEKMKKNDGEFAPLQEMLDALKKKHEYHQQMVKRSSSILTNIFLRDLDVVVEEVCEGMRPQLLNGFGQVILSDRANIPGPMALE